MNRTAELRLTPRLYKVPNEYWQINVNHDELITRNIINLCPGGMAFKTPARIKYEKGQWLHLQIWLSPDKSFECEAKVVWAKDQSYGLQFFKIPMIFDAFIMRAIHESNFNVYRSASEISASEGEDTELLNFPAASVRAKHRKLERGEKLSSVLSLLMIAAMAFAFITAAIVHQRNNPGLTLDKIFEGAFKKNLEK